MSKKVTTTTTVTTVTTTTASGQHDYILLDRSGSMVTKWADSLGGVNGYVQNLAKNDATKDILVTVAVFDSGDTCQVLRKAVPASAWKNIGDNEAWPRGGTPLYDAIGRLVSIANQDSPEKSAIVIVTDGQENESREFTKESSKKLLDTCREKGWQTIFLGADFDNMSQSSGLGNSVTSSMSYAAHNSADVFKSMARTRGVYASGLSQEMNFSSEERAAATAPKKDTKTPAN